LSRRQDAPATVLIVTRRLDDHIELVEPELAARGVRAVRLDTDLYEQDRNLVRFSGGGSGASALLRVDGEELDGAGVGAVLFRHLHVPTAPGVAAGAARELAESELRATLEGSLLSLDAHWLNHPHCNRLARHKLLQLALAARAGLTVPDTRVTSDPEEIRSLYRAWDGRMIAKLAGGQIVADSADDQYAIFTTQLDEQDLLDDDALAACPALYQRLVPKAFELRVTVVGDATFSCRIDSQSTADGTVDWRRAVPTGIGIEPYEVDAGVAATCCALTRRLGLEFAGIDLIVTPDGETVFLELNAAGTWAWAERSAGLPIAAAIADNLVAGARRVRARRPLSPAPG
jgi:glutathione synthase/RimK-type ligase-like ATP-grasp enzyme